MEPTHAHYANFIIGHHAVQLDSFLLESLLLNTLGSRALINQKIERTKNQ